MLSVLLVFGMAFLVAAVASFVPTPLIIFMDPWRTRFFSQCVIVGVPMCYILLKKVRQFRFRHTEETLFTPEEREAWRQERRQRQLRYVVANLLRLSLVLTLFFFLVVLAYQYAQGKAILRAPAVLATFEVVAFCCALRCALRLFEWWDYEDDEREWQRKHPAAAS